MDRRKNTLMYTKDGRRRPGLFSAVKNTAKREDPAEKDRNNRKETVKMVVEHIECGMELDEAVLIVSKNQDVLNKFKYLVNAGVDLKVSIKQWYLSSTSKEKKYYPHNDER